MKTSLLLLLLVIALVSTTSVAQRTYEERFSCVVDEIKSKIAGRDICRTESLGQVGKATFEAEQDDGRLMLFSKPIARRSNPNDFSEGMVVLRIQFLRNGNIGRIKVVSGLNNGLNGDAIAAARKIKFQPVKLKGKPTTVFREIEYRFRIY